VLPAAGRIRRPGQLTDPEVSERFALENFPDYYHEFGGLLDWYNPWDAVLESTSDGYWRAGQWIDHKEKADQARDLAVGENHRVEKVLIWERHRGQYRSEHALVEGRDVVVDDVIGEFRGQRVEPEHMRADETLFLVYTSGSTGKPRRPGIPPVATSPTVTAMSKLILDLKPTDVYWCIADIGWITGVTHHRWVCTALRPSARLEPVHLLRGFCMLVPHVHLPVSPDRPGSSGSTDPPGRCHGCSHRPRRHPGIDAEFPADLTVHLVCDNYGTHKTPAVKTRLAAHPRFQMHFTPTYSSWLNQVVRFFAFSSPKTSCNAAITTASSNLKQTSAAG